MKVLAIFLALVSIIDAACPSRIAGLPEPIPAPSFADFAVAFNYTSPSEAAMR